MRALFGLIIIVLGISFFVQIPIFHFLVALFIIAIGWKILTGQSPHSREWRNWERHHRVRQRVSHDLDEVGVFVAIKKRIDADDFEDGRVISIFAGADIDLSDVETSAKTVYLELVSVFGGIKIRLPKNWKVVNKSTQVLGGIDDRTSGSGNVVVKITGATVFGGIEIYN